MSVQSNDMKHPVRWREENNIGFVMLDNPPSNVMHKNFFESLKNIIDGRISSHIRAIVVYSTGRHFSSGASPDELLEMIREDATFTPEKRIQPPPFLNEHYNSFLRLHQLSIPVIAAIRGVCMGSALELALHCHIRICGDGAVLGLPEATFGLMPGCGGFKRLTALAGQAKAMELILSGRSFSAEEAQEWNIIDRAVPKKEVINIATQLAMQISTKNKTNNNGEQNIG